MEKSINRRQLLRWGMLGGASVTLAACAPKVVEVTREVEKVVEQTVVVEKEKQVEVTKVVEKEKVVTAMPAPAQKHDMVMYVGWGGLWGKLNEELVAMFIEKNPTYTIEVLTGHDWDKLTVAIAGGNPPDVSHAYWGWGRLIATQGGWTNLTPRVDLGGPCAKENFDQVAWDMTSRNGEPYCIPYLVVGTFPCMIWNMNLFEKSGLDPEVGPKTTDELLLMGEKLTTYDKDGNIDVLGYNSSGWDITIWAPTLGVEFYDPTRRVFNINQEPLAEHLGKFAALTHKIGREKIIAVNQAHQGGTYTPEGMFPSEHEAIFISSGDWLPGELRQSAPHLEGRYRIDWMPCDIGKKVTRAYAHTIGIPRGAKDQDGAWELIQYLAASEEAATKAFKDVSAMYPWKPWRDKNDWSQMPYAQWFVDHFQTADLLAPPLHPEVFGLIGSEFYNRMDPAVEEVMLGTMKPAEALQRAQDELQPILDKAVKQYGG